MAAPFDGLCRMREIISQQPLMLMVLRRFSISLGFGNATVGEVCARNGVDCDTFLAVTNFICGREWRQNRVDLISLMFYLKNSHSYFLDFELPLIRRKLIEAVPVSDPGGVGLLLLQYFDDYMAEVRAHMEFENKTVFPYIENLPDNEEPDTFDIDSFSESHAPLGPKLKELKEIFVSHYQEKGNEDLLNAVLFDIITCEADISSHCHVEDTLLLPEVRKLLISRPEQPNRRQPASSAGKPELTSREKEIIKWIARGLSNKEIAEKLFVSIHTITTHRRNICAKLDIHSAAALTIYAIIHKFVDVSEVAKDR